MPEGNDRQEQIAATTPRHQVFVPDDEMIGFVAKTYGAAMAAKVAEMFDLDRYSETGFVRSVRRSITREMEKG